MLALQIEIFCNVTKLFILVVIISSLLERYNIMSVVDAVEGQMTQLSTLKDTLTCILYFDYYIGEETIVERCHFRPLVLKKESTPRDKSHQKARGWQITLTVASLWCSFLDRRGIVPLPIF